MTTDRQLPLCRLHRLHVGRIDKEGIWLDGGEQPVRLPRREAPNAAPGDELEVFVYQSGTGEILATTRRPLAQAGEFALLAVSSTGPHGAFLDWGLAKDLLVPVSLQPVRMRTGERHLVKVDVDQQGRPFGNARLDDCIDRGCPDLAEGDRVELIIWQLTDLGARVIVNHRYPGLLYRDELPARCHPGMPLSGYLKRMREDGKLDVSLHREGVDGILDARKVILKALAGSGGSIPLHDGSSPAEIKGALGLSKKVFKKAVGGLYKDGVILLTDQGISLAAGNGKSGKS